MAGKRAKAAHLRIFIVPPYDDEPLHYVWDTAQGVGWWADRHGVYTERSAYSLDQIETRVSERDSEIRWLEVPYFMDLLMDQGL